MQNATSPFEELHNNKGMGNQIWKITKDIAEYGLVKYLV